MPHRQLSLSNANEEEVQQVKDLNRFSRTVALPSAALSDQSSTNSAAEEEEVIAIGTYTGGQHESMSLQPTNLNTNGSNSSLM